MIKFPQFAEFARRPLGTSLPERFGDAASPLDDIYERLAMNKRVGTLPKWAVQSTIMLSSITGRRVLSIASDDEEWDLACEAQGGALAHLIFDAGGEDIQVSNNDMVLSSPAPDQKLIHRVARRAATNWCEDLAPLFGFDGDPNQLSLIEVARVKFQPESPSLILSVNRSSPHPERLRRDRPFWKFW